MIVSTTLCGPAHLPNLAGALESARGIVVHQLVVDTSPEGAAGLEVPSDVDVRRWPWRGDFSAARNAAVDFAERSAPGIQFTSKAPMLWALTLDSDERIACPDPRALWAFLCETDAECVEAANARAGYFKPRLIRLPSKCRWVGPNHEYLEVPSGKKTRTDLLAFTELEHDAEHLDAKWRRNLEALIPFAAQHPSPRWHYYIARAHYGLGEWEDALSRYEACASAPGWNEQAAYARFEGASILTQELGRHAEALRWCILGLELHAGMAELAWIAALACYRLGRREQARCWAELAQVHKKGSRAERARRGFRHETGLTTGPDDVLRYVEEACTTT